MTRSTVISWMVCWSWTTLLGQDILNFQRTSFHWQGNVEASFTHMSFSNWSAGGDEYSYALGLKSNLNPSASNGMWSFNASWDGEFSMMKSKSLPVRKTNDRLDFSLKFGRKVWNSLHLVVAADLQSQFWPGYDIYEDPDQEHYVSNFMAPGYLLAGLALDLRLDSLNLSVLCTPVASKITYVLDHGVDPTSYSINPGKKTHTEFGAYVHVTFSKEILPKTNATIKSVVFVNYAERFEPDLSLHGELDYNITSFLKLFASVQLLNDDDIKVRVYEDLDHDGSSDDFAGVGPRLQSTVQLGLLFSISF